MRWPWPQSEIAYLTDRARRVLGDDTQAITCTAALLDVLAEFGDIADRRHGDVTDLKRWAQRQTATRLNRWLLAAVPLQVAAGAAGRRPRRGDLIRLTSGPWGPTWTDMRDH